jgi:hypothetical protein
LGFFEADPIVVGILIGAVMIGAIAFVLRRIARRRRGHE